MPLFESKRNLKGEINSKKMMQTELVEGVVDCISAASLKAFLLNNTVKV